MLNPRVIAQIALIRNADPAASWREKRSRIEIASAGEFRFPFSVRFFLSGYELQIVFSEGVKKSETKSRKVAIVTPTRARARAMPTKFIWKVERVRPLVTFAHWITVFPVEYAKRVFTKGKSRTIAALSIFYEIYRETGAKMDNGSCEDPESEFSSLIQFCISELSARGDRLNIGVQYLRKR